MTKRLLLGVAVLAATALGSTSPATSNSTLRVVAIGLDNPRKLVTGPDGALYVVEAGSGGAKDAVIPHARSCVSGSCMGTSASITRIGARVRTRVVTGLPSVAERSGLQAEGPSGVVVEGDTYYVLLQDTMSDAPGGVDQLGPYAGDLIATRAGQATPKVIARLGAFEATHDPDHGAGPGKRYGEPAIDSDPYALAAYRGGFAVVDAGGNDLLWVGPKGRISVLAVFPTETVALTRLERKRLGVPKPPRSLRVQSVPSSVAVGPDGALYVGELTGWPFRPGTARVWRVVPGEKPSVYASGFTCVSDLAFDGEDLLVLEIASAGFGRRGDGALLRVTPDGARTVLASAGLAYPTGLAVGDDAIYVANNGIYPSTGAGPHGELVAVTRP